MNIETSRRYISPSELDIDYKRKEIEHKEIELEKLVEKYHQLSEEMNAGV